MIGTEDDVLRDLIGYLDASPTPYHAVREAAARLEAAGFQRLAERDAWQLESAARAYLTRDGSLIAFVLGSESPADAGFVLVGAHTDSPNLRLKPNPAFSQVGYRELGVEVYGGVLLSTWLDRDLSLAGRVALAGGKSELIRLNGPLCVVPNLAIHLNRQVNKDGLVLNPEKHMSPILSLERDAGSDLEALIARGLAQTPSAGAPPRDVVGFDLCLFDTLGASIGGAHGELLSSARLDNLVSCHAAISALIGAGHAGQATRVIALHDHEEVGSESAAGARSELLGRVLERLARAYPDSDADAMARAAARSFFVSVDMAHAVHPNYADKHDERHRPVLGKGPVVKVNTNQSYATDGVAQAAFVEACRAEGAEPQLFAARNDMPCGSTIGPISAARLGVRAIDVGSPMLAMHSCRETAAGADAVVMIRVLRRLLTEPPTISAT